MVHRHDRPRVVGSPACPLVQTSGRRSAVSSCRDHWPNRIGRLRGEMHGAPASERPGQATPLGLVGCDEAADAQMFVHGPETKTIRPSLDDTRRLGVGASSRSAGPFVARGLGFPARSEADMQFQKWIIRRRPRFVPGVQCRRGRCLACSAAFDRSVASSNVLPGTISSRRDHEGARHVGTRRTA